MSTGKESKVLSCLISAGNVCMDDSNSSAHPHMQMSVDECDSSVGNDFGVTNKFYQVGKFPNMKSVNCEVILRISLW